MPIVNSGKIIKLFKKAVKALKYPFWQAKKYALRFYYAQAIKKRIKKFGGNTNPYDLKIPVHSSKPLAEQVFIPLTYRVNSATRYEILKVAVDLNLKDLAGQGLNLQILDASDQTFAEQNKAFFDQLAGFKVGFNKTGEKEPKSVYQLLSESSEPYFCRIFDDQPVVGLTAEFLQASCQLLLDFQNLVNLVYISDTTKQVIDHSGKKLIYDMSDLDFRTRGVKPLAVVAYGNYPFAIIPNVLSGFFFNTVIGHCSEYKEKLKWYINRVSEVNSRLIEIAGSQFRGPSYHFLAVPLTVFQINIDFNHTENSTRHYSGVLERELFEALKNNYEIIVRPANVP